ncbi:MAG: hypothetical protein JSV88_08835 [Candidatus Aminicenantes bacterium]|nr:MAG: hypothetical protein JSV88_08835 [Candidatus Aminicenantes bacterium]
MKIKELKAKLLPVLKRNKILYLAFLILIIMFSITRLPFFLYYPVVDFDGDSPYYYMNVDQIDKGLWPAFMIRTPGYPLFIKFVFLFFNKNISLIAIQNIFSLLTSLFFIYVIHKVYGRRFKFLPLFASIGLGAFISGSIHLISDTSFMTESLYVNFLVLFFALFILAIHAKTTITWILCSICMAAVILIRPSALFFVLVSFIIMFFLLINSYKKKAVFLFAVPFFLVLFLTSLYNYITIGSFSVSTFTENALISFTSTFLEKSQTYPPGVNEAIEKCQDRVRSSHKDVMENSWNCKKLTRVLKRYYNRSRKLIFSTLITHEKEDSFGLYMKWRPILRKIAIDAILSRPKIYIKYIYANLFTIFFHSMDDVDFYHILKRRYLKALNYKNYFTQSILDWDTLRYKAHPLQLYSKKEYGSTITRDFPRSFLKEYWDREVFSKIKIKKLRRKKALLIPTFLQRVHQGFKVVHDFIFRNNFWIFIFLFTFIFSLVRLLRSRFHHKDAFILFIMTFSALLHGVVVATASLPILRLIYPMNFVYYLSLFLLPIVIDFDSNWVLKIKAVITRFFPRL